MVATEHTPAQKKIETFNMFSQIATTTTKKQNTHTQPTNLL